MTVETEAMETQGVHTKGALPWMVRWPRCGGTRYFCPALAAFVSTVQNIVFLTVHYFASFVTIAQQAGQAVVLRHLSLNMCLCICIMFQLDPYLVSVG